MSLHLSTVLRKLSRETSGGGFIPNIDGLRFVAIAAVLLYHIDGYVAVKTSAPNGLEVTNSLLHSVFSKGFFGVQLFFVISGFVLGMPFASRYLLNRKPISLKRYFFRRLTRLEPPYIINLLILATLMVFVGHLGAIEALKHLLASLAYMHNQVYGAGSLINGVAWSLEVEVQFYLLAPLLAMLFMIPRTFLRRVTILCCIALSSILQRVWAIDLAHGLSLGNQIHYFLAGFLLVDLYLLDWTSSDSTEASRPSFFWDTASLASWGMIVSVLMSAGRLDGVLPFRNSSEMALPFLVITAYIGAFRGRFLPIFFGSPLVYTIGGMCYTIYLWHYHVISLAGHFTQRLPAARTHWGNVFVQGAFMIPIVLVFSAVAFAVCERPFMKRDWPAAFRRRVFGRSDTAIDAAASTRTP
jgi:peptidoglycan/LPS O-acetylase OafA/YrhL